MLELIRTYYQYEQWASGHVLDAAERVPFEQLTVSVLDGFEPVRSIFVHTMWAQRHWLARFQGEPQIPEIAPEHFADLDSIRAWWETVDTATNAFLAELVEDRATADFTYPGMNGGTFTYPLWQAMLHQANHATYHRGEIAAILTHLGASPGELDFFRMFDRR